MLVDILQAYAVLFIVPAAVAPIQVLYLKSGQRYDLGASMYIATGAFLAAALPLQNPEHRVIVYLCTRLVLFSALAFLARVFALAYGRPSDFTLVSLGQYWATPSFIYYHLSKLTNGSGVNIGDVCWPPICSVISACVVALLVSYVISRLSLGDRLVAATEAPRQYGLMFGSKLQLALGIEILAFGSLAISGALLRLISNDLSPDTFGTETLWCVLAVAFLGRTSSAAYALLGPLMVTVLRLILNITIPAKWCMSVVYALMVVLLIARLEHSEKGSRDAFT